MILLADATDVAARLGRDLTDSEAERVPGLLAEASALARGWCGTIPDPVPAEVAVAVSRMVARALVSTATAGVTQEAATAGPFSMSTTYTPETGVWLGRQDKMLLRPWRHRQAANVPTH